MNDYTTFFSPLSNAVDLDFPIIEILKKINSIGLITCSSCIGYKYPRHLKPQLPNLTFIDLSEEKLNLLKKVISGTAFYISLNEGRKKWKYYEGPVLSIYLPSNLSKEKIIYQWNLLSNNLSRFINKRIYNIL